MSECASMFSLSILIFSVAGDVLASYSHSNFVSRWLQGNNDIQISTTKSNFDLGVVVVKFKTGAE